MTPEEQQRAFNSRLATWADRTCGDIVALVKRGVLHLPQGTAQVPEIVIAQLRVIVGFALREAALAGQQLQARKANKQADREVLREDRPLAGVTATARRVVSDLRPREHVTQRFPAVVAPPLPPAAKETEQRWDDITTVPTRRPDAFKPIPDVDD